jgi:hypothetical protein
MVNYGKSEQIQPREQAQNKILHLDRKGRHGGAPAVGLGENRTSCSGGGRRRGNRTRTLGGIALLSEVRLSHLQPPEGIQSNSPRRRRRSTPSSPLLPLFLWADVGGSRYVSMTHYFMTYYFLLKNISKNWRSISQIFYTMCIFLY